MKTSSLIFIFIILLSACASTPSDYDTPVVNVYSFKALPSSGLAPEFEIGLRIINPNRTPLALSGMAYNIYIEGHQIITGVANKLPVVEPYGEGEVTVLATTNLFSSLSLLAELLKQQKNAYNYRFEAKLDQGGIAPNIRVVKKGKVDLK